VGGDGAPRVRVAAVARAHVRVRVYCSYVQVRSNDLTRRLFELLRAEHSALAEFLVALADFDRNRGWLDAGHSSLFYFLHRELRLSKGAAYHRKVAAELLQKFPEVIEPLRDGRLCLSSVVELSRVMNEENRPHVLQRFFHCSKQEAREVAAEISPRPAPTRVVVTAVAPACLRGELQDVTAGPAANTPLSLSVTPDVQLGIPADARAAVHLGEPPGVSSAQVPLGEPPGVSSAQVHLGEPPGVSSAQVHLGEPPDVSSEEHLGEPSAAALPPANSPRSASSLPRDATEPLTADLRRLHVTVTRRFLEKLDAARDALSHARAGATVEEVLESALDTLLEQHARRKGCVEKPRAKPRPSKPDHIPAAVKRQVWRRDQGRCQWPVKSGGVCGSTLRLEFDHVTPRARGGPSTVENVRLLCRAHNQIAARRAFGNTWMDRFGKCRRRRPPS
jgi:hypothetical protein